MYVSFILGNLCLLGFPFFSGYFSKDRLLELVISLTWWPYVIAFGFLYISAGFTLFYTFSCILLCVLARIRIAATSKESIIYF